MLRNDTSSAAALFSIIHVAPKNSFFDVFGFDINGSYIRGKMLIGDKKLLTKHIYSKKKVTKYDT